MVDGAKLKKIFQLMEKTMEENKIYLSELDGAAGDGDHGLNMAKGFLAVVNKLKDSSNEDVGKILKIGAMALISNVGGAAGPLYGTAFLKASTVVEGKSYINIDDYLKILEKALEGIKERGKAEVGEKTMIDCLAPAIDEGKKARDEGLGEKEVLVAIERAAKVAMEDTKKIVATKGRASYLGEQSKGHQDAGATSMYLLLKSVREAL